MKRGAWLAGLATFLLTSSAWASVFLLAATGESTTLECRADGLYLGYQLDDLEFQCTAIKARTDGGKWVQYAAHNGSHSGFVRNKRSSVRKNGAPAERLLQAMLKASTIEFLNPGTGQPVSFSISKSDQIELQSIASKCGA